MDHERQIIALRWSNINIVMFMFEGNINSLEKFGYVSPGDTQTPLNIFMHFPVVNLYICNISSNTK